MQLPYLSGLKKKLTTWISRGFLPFTVIVILVFVQLEDPLARNRIRDISFDQLQKMHPGLYDDNIPIRVIAIDDQSLAAVGQWPWPRTVLAQIVDQLNAAGASVIVMDMLLAEADRTSPELVKQFWPDNAQLDALLARFPSHDQLLAASFARARVVSAVAAHNKYGQGSTPSPKLRVVSDGGDARDWMRGWAGATGFISPLVDSTIGAGVVTVVPDHDGILRSMPLLSMAGDVLYPGLGLEALRTYLGVDTVKVRVRQKNSTFTNKEEGIEGLELGRAAFLPTSGDTHVWLHARPLAPQRYVSAIDVLTGRVEPKRIRDHIVLIGATSVGLGDTLRTPLGEVVPGVEGHLQLVEQLMTNTYLLRPQWENTLVVGLLLVTGFLLAVMLEKIRPAWSVLLVSTPIVCMFIGADWLFVNQRLLFDPLYPAAGLTALFLSMAIPRYLRTESEQRWIKTAFSRYVSPNRVRYLQEHPETLNLGGEYRECSFVMTDLAGFTSMMEKYEPSVLSSLLNEYLNGMIEIAFAHEGTLDRIVGDAVAVMFSAPVQQADHAKRAVACALAMDRFAHQFSQHQQSMGIPFGKTRIGVNTGNVMVGNFGGQVMLDYRALGDAINTAARLETVNGHLGTRISVSESTAKQCPDFLGRTAARLVLKGKKQAVTVYEPWDDADDASEQLKLYREAYALLDLPGDEAAIAFAKLQALFPDDPLVKYHMHRLENGETGSLVVMDQK